MAKYKSESVKINQPVEAVYARLTNFSGFNERLAELPEEARAKLGDVKFGDDSIIINTPNVGEIAFTIIERKEPSLVKLGAANSPVPFDITVNLTPESAETTEAQTEINVEIPAMLKPLVGGKLQEAANQFGNMLSTMFKA